MKAPILTCVLLIMSMSLALSQTDFVINKSKSIRTEYTPVPKDFKTKKIAWGEVSSTCQSEDVQYGTWFNLYPNSHQLRVTVSTGLNWGNLTDPVIFLAYLDTEGDENQLVPLGCIAHAGDQGDFVLELTNLRPGEKHYLLVGSPAKKQKFALYLTERFEVELDEEVPSVEVTDVAKDVEDAEADDAIEKQEAEQKPILQNGRDALIIGRVRKRSGKAISSFDIALLNDNLQEVSNVTTDESGVFRIEGVDPSQMNLIRLGDGGDKAVVDMFLYDRGGNIIAKPVSLGHSMLSFRPSEEGYDQMNVLTERDLVVLVKQGKTTMTGKVVDAETYLIGREGVRVGLYTPAKRLLRSAITDHDGKFLFTQLEKRDYVVRVDHNPTEDYVEIVLADDQNQPYAISTSDDEADDGYFRFRKLPTQDIDMTPFDHEDDSDFQHHYYTMLSEEEPGVPYEIHSLQFKTGSSTLPGQNDELDQLARELIESPEVEIKIDGHTDNIGSRELNNLLSLRRAEAVKDYLVNRGVKSKRIQCEGFGASHPIAENDTPRGRSINRRVEFSILE